jgi:hypothetical protein
MTVKDTYARWMHGFWHIRQPGACHLQLKQPGHTVHAWHKAFATRVDAFQRSVAFRSAHLFVPPGSAGPVIEHGAAQRETLDLQRQKHNNDVHLRLPRLTAIRQICSLCHEQRAQIVVFNVWELNQSVNAVLQPYV